MASRRVQPKPSKSDGHVDQGGYAPGPFGPEFGGVSGSFRIEDQFNVRKSASQPEPASKSLGADWQVIGEVPPAKKAS